MSEMLAELAKVNEVLSQHGISHAEESITRLYHALADNPDANQAESGMCNACVFFLQQINCDTSALSLTELTQREGRIEYAMSLTQFIVSLLDARYEDEEVITACLNEALTVLDALGHEVAVNASEDPEALQETDWYHGMNIAETASVMADIYATTLEDDNKELQARCLEVKVLSSIAGQYPHIVAPSVINVSSCFAKTGQAEQALYGYYAVIKDFSWIVGEFKEGDTLTPEESMALEALKIACERYIGSVEEDAFEILAHATETLEKAELILSTAEQVSEE